MLDVDALNMLSDTGGLAARIARRDTPTLLTPLPGEAARLLDLPVGTVPANRIVAARTHSAHAHEALKGAGTLAVLLGHGMSAGDALEAAVCLHGAAEPSRQAA